jgi:succinoglycan biosynthesis protein ExoM
LLDRLLHSLRNQALPKSVDLDVIVVDNDAAGSGESVVAKYGNLEHIRFRYFSQPVRNISLTRNMAVANATGTYLLFIDDDEVAAPDWCRALLDSAAKYEADGVFGPVYPIFENTAPRWLTGSIHLFIGHIPKKKTGTPASSTWCGNCLMRAEIMRTVPGPFNAEYGTTGGEDTELFDRLKAQGARFIYCDEAIVHEYWPAARSRVSYLFHVNLKGGNDHTRRFIGTSRRKPIARALMVLKAVTYGAVSVGLALIALPSRVWRTYWTLKLASNIGRFMAAVGHHYEAYR